jgi:hypothetical protein
MSSWLEKMTPARQSWVSLAAAFGLGAFVGTVASHFLTAREQSQGRVKQKTVETNPKKLLNYARQYLNATEVVFNNEPGRMTRPLNYLYFQTLELLLKSFLRAKGRFPKRNHEIDVLYKQAVGLGLRIPGDRFELQNIVSLLQAGNTGQAFRYGTSQGTSEPTLDWTRDVLRRLMAAVEADVDPDPSATPGPVESLTVVFAKPIPKTR